MHTKAVNIGEKRSKITTRTMEKETLGTSEETTTIPLRRSMRIKGNASNGVYDEWHDEENSAHAKLREEQKQCKRYAKAASKRTSKHNTEILNEHSVINEQDTSNDKSLQ